MRSAARVVVAALLLALASTARAAGPDRPAVRVELPPPPFATVGTDAPGADDAALRDAVETALPGLRWCQRLAAAAAGWGEATADVDGLALPPSVVDMALRWAGLPDPSAVVTVVATDRDGPHDALAHVAQVATAAEIPYTHVGLVRLAGRGSGPRWRWIGLLSRRALELEPMPARLDPGQRVVAAFRLDPSLDDPQLAVLLPGGEVHRVAPRRTQAGWTATLPVAREPGTLWLQILAVGDTGSGVRGLVRLEVGREPTFALDCLPPGPADASGGEEAEMELLALVNADRTRHGLAPVVPDPVLARVARAHSRDMAEHRFFAHRSPRHGGLAERLEAAGYAARSACENIAQASTVAGAQAGLLESPSHRANLLNPEVTRVGLGVVASEGTGEPRLYVTQVFALPSRQLGAAELEGEVRRMLAQARRAAGVAPAPEDADLDQLAAALARGAAAGGGLGPAAMPAGRTGRLQLELVESEDAADLQLPGSILSPSLKGLGVGVACSGRPPRQRHHVVLVLAD